MQVWSDIGNEYIYRISIDNKVYIGQSRAKDPGSRLEYRLRGPFSMKVKGDEKSFFSNYDVEEMAEDIRKRGLKNVKVEYYTKESNFGVSQELMKEFKNSFTTGNGSEISDLNVAEILHILHHSVQGYKLYNVSMGGTDGSINFDYKTEKDNDLDKTIANSFSGKKMLTKMMTPKEAEKIFFSSTAELSSLSNLRDELNDLLFTNKWKKFYDSIKNDEQKKDRLSRYKKSDLELTWEEKLNDIFSNVSLIEKIINYQTNEFKEGLEATITGWIWNKLDFFQDYLDYRNIPLTIRKENLKGRMIISDQVDKMATYIAKGISNQVINDSAVREAFFKMMGGKVRLVGENKIKFKNFKSSFKATNESLRKRVRNSFNIISFSAIFDLKNMRKGSMKRKWMVLFNSWTPNGAQAINEDLKKEIMYKFFVRVFKKTRNEKNYVEKGEKEDLEPFKQDSMTFVYGSKAEVRTQTLSAKIHEKFQEMGLSFVKGVWKNFYGRMISLYYNNLDEWNFLETEKRTIAYREGSSVIIEDGEDSEKAFIAHSVKDKVFWQTSRITEIEIY